MNYKLCDHFTEEITSVKKQLKQVEHELCEQTQKQNKSQWYFQRKKKRSSGTSTSGDRTVCFLHLALVLIYYLLGVAPMIILHLLVQSLRHILKVEQPPSLLLCCCQRHVLCPQLCRHPVHPLQLLLWMVTHQHTKYCCALLIMVLQLSRIQLIKHLDRIIFIKASPDQFGEA